MTTLKLTVGQQLTFNELGNELESNNSSEIWNNIDPDVILFENKSLDNYDGEQGWNVEFEVIEKKDDLLDTVLKITNIYDL